MPSFIDTMTGKTTKRKTDEAERKALGIDQNKSVKKVEKKKPRKFQAGSVSAEFWGD